MKIIFLFFSFISLLYGDDPCDGERKTELKFHMEFPHNILLEKHYTSDGCGYEKTELNLFQNSHFVGGSEAEYGIDILFIGDINRDKKTEVVYTSHKAGHGMNEHGIAVIEPIMKKPFSVGGYSLYVEDIDDDGSLEFLSGENAFFCISSYFCSHGTAPSINTAMEFNNGSLVIDKTSMRILKNRDSKPCDTNVSVKFAGENDEQLIFKKNECAKYNLKNIAYDLYIQDLEAFKIDFKHFIFESNQSKKVFKQKFIQALKNYDTIIGSDLYLEIKIHLKQF